MKYEEGSKKYKEIYVRKRAGGRFNESNVLFRCGAFCRCWKKRYFIINSEGIMYSVGHEPRNIKIREFLLFDHNFRILYGK
jgi:hypothetical protein